MVQQPLNADSLEADLDNVQLSSGHSASTGELSDVQSNNPEPGKTSSQSGRRRTVAESWRTAVRLIDRLLFVVLLVVYVLMMVEWLPEGYLTGRNDGDLTLGVPKKWMDAMLGLQCLIRTEGAISLIFQNMKNSFATKHIQNVDLNNLWWEI